MKQQSEFIRAKEVSERMGCSISTAYKQLQEIRLEMKAEGLLTLAGVVPRKRWERKVGLT
jgi:hypothetical protein